MKPQQAIQKQSSDLKSVTGPGKYSFVIEKIVECANNHLLMLVKQMMSTADEKLNLEANKAKTEEEHKKYIACTRLFLTERNDICHLFFMNLNKSLETSQADAATIEDTSLVDQDEMDEMVAITTMHTKAMNIYGPEVKNLEARLEYLEIMCAESFDKDALDPKHICEVFQRTIENIDLAIEVKLIFYKLFDREVCSKLGAMYRALNQLLVENDILPEIVLSTTTDIEIDTNEGEVSSRVATYYDPEEKVHTDFIPRTKEEISRIVNEFMSGEMTITGDEIDLPESFLRAPTQQDIDGKNCYQRKDVLRALSNLQRKLISLHKEARDLTTSQIKQELLDDIEKTIVGDTGKKVNLLDERSMDFVGMMFDAIANDETISPVMKSLINRLQVPVIKLAMTDSKLFDQEAHPARVTIDLLTTAGKGINNLEDRLYDDLAAVVDEILEKYDADLETFEKAIVHLQDIVYKEKQLATKIEKQQQRQVLLEHARYIITTQLKILLRNKKVPEQIKPLVLKNWVTLMLNRYLRYGRGSLPWTESVLLLKLLIKCIQPIRLQSQYNLVNNNHLALAEAVNEELFETRQDKGEISRQVEVLKTHFLQLIKHYDIKLVEETGNDSSEQALYETDSDDTVNEEQQIQQQMAIAKQKIARLSNSTKPGVWYEVYVDNHKANRRLKLSVILTEEARLIFVDRKGVKVIEKDAEEFARELEDRRSRMLADHSTFDHALGQVIGRMAA